MFRTEDGMAHPLALGITWPGEVEREPHSEQRSLFQKGHTLILLLSSRNFLRCNVLSLPPETPEQGSQGCSDTNSFFFSSFTETVLIRQDMKGEGAQSKDLETPEDAGPL